jgi:hypothetical protein
MSAAAWFCIPSARPTAEANVILRKWKDRGYCVALWRDSDQDAPVHDLLLTGPYPGYARATNAVIAAALARDQQCSWVVCGGDDIEPDSNFSPEEIASQCQDHFQSSFGVMQPTGDRWANGSIDRICGSPWIGREFCERAYSGAGPFFEGYRHMFVDEELQHVAQRLGAFQQRRDLIHLHRHWRRTPGTMCPPHLVMWSGPKHWQESQQMFELRLARGFPGHEPRVKEGVHA